MSLLALRSAALVEAAVPISTAWPAQIVAANSLASMPGNSRLANPSGSTRRHVSLIDLDIVAKEERPA